MQRLNCIIVDDEEIARLRLHKLLSDYPDLEVIDEAENGLIALEKIKTLNPDLVFLDIQMPGLNGFDVLNKLPRQPVIIFTTAYDEFAIKAFDENAVAYLLKPINKEKLSRAIKKSMQLIKNSEQQLYTKLLDFVEKKDFRQFVSKIGTKVKFIAKEDVCYISSKDKHTFIHLVNGSKYIIDQTLNELEEILDQSFIRAHRSFIICKNFITDAERVGDGKYLFTLKDNKQSQLQSSSTYSAQVRKSLGF